MTHFEVRISGKPLPGSASTQAESLRDVPPGEGRERGSMLVIALVVLSMIAIIAVTFAALMRLERNATKNFVNASSAELLTGSAESAVIAMLRGAPLWDGYTDFSSRQRTPWLYGFQTGFGDLRYGNILQLDNLENADESSYTGDVGASEAGTASQDRFVTKIIDCNSQIFLNGDQDTLAQMLDNLGEAIRRNPDIAINPLYSKPRMGGKQITGEQIMRYRSRLPGREFSSKTQLKDLIGVENFQILADFVTAKAWVNPYTMRSSGGREPVKAVIDGNDVFDQSGIEARLNPRVEGAPSLIGEPRAPINVNTAPREVLIACLTGLGGRRAFPLTELVRQGFEAQNLAEIEVEGGSLPPTQEELTLVQVPVWVYSQPLQIDQAVRLADEIITARKSRPFKVWQSGDSNQPGFEEFINSLDESIFPAPGTITVVNPRDPGGNYKSQILGSGDGSGLIFRKGHDSNERSARRRLGMASSAQNAWYFDMMRDMLKANFNPNTRINKFNPNRAAFVAVDKANLIKLADEGRNRDDAHVGHTTDFCFDSKGIYEVTTFAEILVGQEESSVVTFAETKRRSVVRVFDVVHHTTQRQFEQPFNEDGGTSVRDREFVSTYPDPMDALEPDFYAGSNVDGRIELSGSTDARLQAVRAELRENEFSNSSNLKLAHSFRFRTEPARLKSLIRSRGINAEETRRELRKVLDADYAKNGSRFSQRYGKDLWGTDESIDARENVQDLRVDVALQNTDLQPDGYHMSFMRVNRSGTRILRLPSQGYRDTSTSQGRVASQYNNDEGNLPYYQGGVAFWIKPEFDGDDPIFSGILKATTVQTEQATNASDVEGSEGTQFLIWKNSSGQLRVTRLYYHQSFTRVEGSSSSDQQAGFLYPENTEEDSGEQAPEEIIVDPRKRNARSDVVIDIRDWKAGEWHHVAVQYDDESDPKHISVQVDFEAVPISNHNLGPEQYCALNEHEPKDGIQLGGIFRNQGVKDQGIFKFGTNVQLDSMAQVAPKLKRIPANATIDEFRVFTGVFDRGRDDLGYFTRESGKYTNRFEVPFPEGMQRVRLRSLTWSLYPPNLYAREAVRWSADQNFTMRVAGVNDSRQFVPLGDPGSEQTRNARLAGQWLRAKGNLFGRTGSLLYQFEMSGATGSGTFGDRVVASPAVDDVTLTYYLPSAQVLVSENLD